MSLSCHAATLEADLFGRRIEDEDELICSRICKLCVTMPTQVRLCVSCCSSDAECGFSDSAETVLYLCFDCPPVFQIAARLHRQAMTRGRSNCSLRSDSRLVQKPRRERFLRLTAQGDLSSFVGSTKCSRCQVTGLLFFQSTTIWDTCGTAIQIVVLICLA